MVYSIIQKRAGTEKREPTFPLEALRLDLTVNAKGHMSPKLSVLQILRLKVFLD